MTDGFEPAATLKSDLFGRVERGRWRGRDAVRRDVSAARAWARPLAGWLLRREAHALERIAGDERLGPVLLMRTSRALVRTWIDGLPMQHARPADPAYFREARRRLVALHRRGVVHNDLAKEPNWLVTPDGHPLTIDFQLASCFARRSALFRLLAREDLRHLLKHKRTYCPDALTARERALLARRSLPARLHRRLVKPVYTFVTRGLLGWSDSEGRGRARAEERDRATPGAQSASDAPSAPGGDDTTRSSSSST